MTGYYDCAWRVTNMRVWMGYFGIWVILACANFGCNWGTFFGGGRLLWIMMIFEPNLLQFSSLGLVYGSYEQVAMVQCHVFLTAAGYSRKWWFINKIDYNFHHWVWYMGHTSKWQIHTVTTIFWQLLVTVENDDLSTKLITIFIIELGIWVTRASGNFGCSVPFFDSCRLL